MLQYVNTMVQALPTLQQSYIGVSEAIAAKVNAWVTLGDCTPSPQATQTVRREPEVVVTFVYRVAGDQQAAELGICALVDELTAAIYADRSLGGTSQNATLDMSLNRDPAYMNVSVAEVRRYIAIVRGLQTTNTP
jgi:hypothetical protein